MTERIGYQLIMSIGETRKPLRTKVTMSGLGGATVEKTVIFTNQETAELNMALLSLNDIKRYGIGIDRTIRYFRRFPTLFQIFQSEMLNIC